MNALGRSRGGVSTKIHVLSDANGLPLALHLTPGQTADIAAAPDLLALGEARPRELLADKGYDADDLRADLYLRSIRPIIPWKSGRKAPGTLDRRRYARRNCIERMMGFLKQLRRVATRYDKTAESFLSFVQLAAIHRWIRFVHTASLTSRTPRSTLDICVAGAASRGPSADFNRAHAAAPPYTSYSSYTGTPPGKLRAEQGNPPRG